MDSFRKAVSRRVRRGKGDTRTNGLFRGVAFYV